MNEDLPIKLLARRAGVIAAVLACIAAAPVNANLYSFTTPGGSAVNDGPVSASATFATSTNSIQITINDLLANPTSVGQLVSDISFRADGLTTGAGGANVPSGSYVSVGSGGSTSGGACCANWELTNTNGIYHLTALAGGAYTGPAYLIIGPADGNGVYSDANGSIARNRPHNPFIAESALFTLGVIGATASTVISDVVFSFGTQAGVDVPAVTAVPIPAAAWLFGSGLLGLGAMAKRRRLARSKSA